MDGFNKSVPSLIPRWLTMCLPHSTPLLTSVNGRLAHNKSLSSKGPSLAKAQEWALGWACIISFKNIFSFLFWLPAPSSCPFSHHRPAWPPSPASEPPGSLERWILVTVNTSFQIHILFYEILVSHGGGPALGQAGGLSRLDRWRSWVNEIKRFLVITLSD